MCVFRGCEENIMDRCNWSLFVILAVVDYYRRLLIYLEILVLTISCKQEVKHWSVCDIRLIDIFLDILKKSSNRKTVITSESWPKRFTIESLFIHSTSQIPIYYLTKIHSRNLHTRPSKNFKLLAKKLTDPFLATLRPPYASIPVEATTR